MATHRPKSTKKQKQLTRQLAIKYGRARLQPLIELCAKEHGAKTSVWQALSNMLGYTPTRHQVSYWLNPDPKEWRSPLYAVGAALESIQEKLCPAGRTISLVVEDPGDPDAGIMSGTSFVNLKIETEDAHVNSPEFEVDFTKYIADSFDVPVKRVVPLEKWNSEQETEAKL